MTEDIESLRAEVLQAAAAPAPTIEGLENRPLFLMGAMSELGAMHCQRIASARGNVVAAVADASNEPSIHGVPRWSSEEFLSHAKQYKDAVAIDLAFDRLSRAQVAALCEQAGVECRDCVVAQAQLGLPAVYEAVGTYRQRTLDRLDDFLRLADRFDDDLSRETLYGNLLFRLTYDRNRIVRSSPADEYFSDWRDASTFHLGSREHFVDCGAYQGPIVKKFLGATGHRYGSITAYEPDHVNFKILSELTSSRLHDCRAINRAVSSRRQRLRFNETGTMSSYVAADGNVVVDTIRLDDELEEMTFLKMDIEGFETDALKGAQRLLSSQRPRAAVCVYHYAHCLVRVMEQFDTAVENYHFRLRQHFGGYFYDLVLYASPVIGTQPPGNAI